MQYALYIIDHILYMRVEQWAPFSVLVGENLARKQTCSCCDHGQQETDLIFDKK